MTEFLFGKAAKPCKAEWSYLASWSCSHLLYLGSLPKEFTNWDDGQYITNNHHLLVVAEQSKQDRYGTLFRKLRPPNLDFICHRLSFLEIESGRLSLP